MRFNCQIIIFICFFLIVEQYNQAQQADLPSNNDTGDIEKLLSRALGNLDTNLDSGLILGYLAYDMAKKQDNRKYLYDASKILADAWFYKDSMAKAIDYYKIAADIMLELEGENSEEYASRISDIGYCFYSLDIFEIAISYNNLAYDIFIKTANNEEISNQLNNLGTVYFAWGKYNLALEYFSRTLGYDMERGDSAALTISFNNIGKVYEAWGYYDLAIEHYLKALSYIGENGSESLRATRLSNIGTSYLKKKNYDKALEFLYKALTIDRQLNNQFKIAVRYNEIANVFSATGEYPKAIDYNLEALKILQIQDKKESLAIVLKDLGTNYFEMNNYPLAEDYFRRSISISREIGSIYNEMLAYKVLSEVNEKKRDYLQALIFRTRYDNLKDTIFNTRVHKQLANYRVMYETEKKERENQILKKDILIEKRTQRTLIIIGVLMLMSSVLLFFLFRLRSRTHKQDKKLFEKEKRLSRLELEKKEIEKQQLQDKVFAEQQVNRLQSEKHGAELKLKNMELVNSTLQIVNKNEVLTEIKNKIKHHNTEIRENAYKDLLNLVNHNTDFDQNWKSFTIEFEKINPGF
ncbi:MAG: tetratricopeptide repeat protein, partial [Bacteroidales bacterium]|nr:tetratricopeptide repeat protein [Bacteroidales bacterium]